MSESKKYLFQYSKNKKLLPVLIIGPIVFTGVVIGLMFLLQAYGQKIQIASILVLFALGVILFIRYLYRKIIYQCEYQINDKEIKCLFLKSGEIKTYPFSEILNFNIGAYMYRSTAVEYLKIHFKGEKEPVIVQNYPYHQQADYFEFKKLFLMYINNYNQVNKQQGLNDEQTIKRNKQYVKTIFMVGIAALILMIFFPAMMILTRVSASKAAGLIPLYIILGPLAWFGIREKIKSRKSTRF